MSSPTAFLRSRIPGILYLAVAVTGFYAPYAFGRFVDSGEGLIFLRRGLLSLFCLNLSWLFLAWSLYRSYRHLESFAAGAMLLFVICGLMILFPVILLRAAPLFLGSGTEASVRVLYSMGHHGNNAAYLFYALWLYPLAWLMARDTALRPWARGLLAFSLCIAGTGYLLDFFAVFLSPGAKRWGVTEYTWIGEVVVLLQLLIRGVDPGTKEFDP